MIAPPPKICDGKHSRPRSILIICATADVSIAFENIPIINPSPKKDCLFFLAYCIPVFGGQDNEEFNVAFSIRTGIGETSSRGINHAEICVIWQRKLYDGMTAIGHDIISRSLPIIDESNNSVVHSWDRYFASYANRDSIGTSQDRDRNAARQPRHAGGCRREYHLWLASLVVVVGLLADLMLSAWWVDAVTLLQKTRLTNWLDSTFFERTAQY